MTHLFLRLKNKMSLRDQPYFPFYVDDYLTDEKLIECSAESQGVYIRIMCIMHKSEEYGVILLRQKDKQSDQHTKNFAIKLARSMPFSIEVVQRSIEELVSEKVLIIDGDKLLQKRMVRDNSISVKRSEAGSKGGFATAKNIAKRSAKPIANTVNEYEYEIENINEDINKSSLEECRETFLKNVQSYTQYNSEMLEEFFKYWSELNSSGKMRFQLEDFWEIDKRLERWKERCEKNESKQVQNNKKIW